MSVRVDRYNNNYVQPRKRTMSTNSTSSSGRTRSGTIRVLHKILVMLCP